MVLPHNDQVFDVCLCSVKRVVSSALRCFHDLTHKVADGRCGSDGAAEYQRNYIRPLVDQSRDVVLTRCSLPSPYRQDFISGAAPTRLSDGSGVHRRWQQQQQHSYWSSLSLICAAVMFIANHAPSLALTFLLMSKSFVPLLFSSESTAEQWQQLRDEVDRSATAADASVERKSKKWRRKGLRRQRASVSLLSATSNIRNVIGTS